MAIKREIEHLIHNKDGSIAGATATGPIRADARASRAVRRRVRVAQLRGDRPHGQRQRRRCRPRLRKRTADKGVDQALSTASRGHAWGAGN
jgi:hypothetical protein